MSDAEKAKIADLIWRMVPIIGMPGVSSTGFVTINDGYALLGGTWTIVAHLKDGTSA